MRFSKAERYKVWEKSNFVCCSCGIKLKPNHYPPELFLSEEEANYEHNKLPTMEIDHIIPISRGGSDAIENLQSLCRTCNMIKGNKIPSYVKKNYKLLNVRSLNNDA